MSHILCDQGRRLHILHDAEPDYMCLPRASRASSRDTFTHRERPRQRAEGRIMSGSILLSVSHEVLLLLLIPRRAKLLGSITYFAPLNCILSLATLDRARDRRAHTHIFWARHTQRDRIKETFHHQEHRNGPQPAAGHEWRHDRWPCCQS